MLAKSSVDQCPRSPFVHRFLDWYGDEGEAPYFKYFPFWEKTPKCYGTLPGRGGLRLERSPAHSYYSSSQVQTTVAAVFAGQFWLGKFGRPNFAIQRLLGSSGVLVTS